MRAALSHARRRASGDVRMAPEISERARNVCRPCSFRFSASASAVLPVILHALKRRARGH